MTEFTESNGILSVGRNIAENSGKFARALRSRVSHIFEEAKLLGDEITGGGVGAVKAILTDETVRARVAEAVFSASAFVGERDSYGKLLDKKLDNFDAMCLCVALTENEKYTPRELAEFLLGPSDAPSGSDEKKIALLKNAQANRAFELFAANIRDAMYVYEDNFSDACESVFEGRAKYAVIPTSSSSDGRLDGLYRTMEKYSLATIMACDVVSPDGNSTRFALAGRPSSQSFSGGRIKLEIKITLSDPSFLSEIFEAASFFGARTDAVDSLPDVFGRGNAFGMVFDIEGADVTSLLTYLTLRFSQFVTVGIYPHITEE